jgi:predicted dehydrogenase
VSPDVRAAIAYVASKAAGKSRGATVYDFDRSKYVHFSGRVGTTVSVYDHDAAAHITGPINNLYHHGQSAHIQLQLNGNQFSGYDFGTSNYFQGTIRQTNVQVYDFGDGRWHQFHVV